MLLDINWLYVACPSEHSPVKCDPTDIIIIIKALHNIITGYNLSVTGCGSERRQ